MEATTTLAIQEGYIEHINKFFTDYSDRYPDFVGITHAIKDRQGGTPPDYPYIVVEKTQTVNNEGAWLREIFIEDVEGEEEDKFSYISEQKVSIMVNCYGDNSDDILNVLRSAVVDDMERIVLNELTGAKFQYYTEVDDNPKFLETDFIQGSSLACFFTMITKYTPLLSGFIGSVEVDGDIKNSEDSTESIPVSFNVTQ